MTSLKHSFFKKFIYSVSANAISLLVSIITTLLIPRFLGADIEQYGYLQLYLFYTSYVGFLHFGLVDGILLREGGKEYSEIDKGLYAKEFKIFAGFELLLTAVIAVAAMLYCDIEDKRFVLILFAINIAILLPRAFLQYILQATNRIKEYSITASAGRILYLLMCIATMALGWKNFRFFVIGDVVCKIISLFTAIFYCKDIVFSCKKCNLKHLEVEMIENISAGIKLTLANVSAMLITGIVRFGIEQKWGVATFGNVSLTLSISNLFITFISAIAIVLFPTLRKIEAERLPKLYARINNSLMIPAFLTLVFYYPIKIILCMWLPQYSAGLEYMAILFPLCIYMSKMTLLIQTYYQVLRLEKKLMMINVFGVALAFATTIISVFWLNNLTLTVFSILINQAIRCTLGELYLSRIAKINVKQNIIFENALVIIFVFTNWLIGQWMGCICYLAFYLLYLALKKNDVISLISEIKGIINRNIA